MDELEKKIRKYSSMVYKIAFSILKNNEDSDEIYQETFIKLYKNFNKLKNDEHMKYWLIRVTINNCKMLLRKRKKEIITQLDENISAKEMGKNDVLEIVNGLPEKYRIVIFLFYYENYKVNEISKILRIREGTIKSQLSRARNLLKEMLKEEFDNE